MSSEEFIKNLQAEHREASDQSMPFDRVEDGFTQCIANPNVPNGFITVRIIEPTMYCFTKKQILDRKNKEIQEEEASIVKPEEDSFYFAYQLFQNHYGQIKPI